MKDLMKHPTITKCKSKNISKAAIEHIEQLITNS